MIDEINQIRNKLKELGDEERAKNSKRYLKSSYDFYGLKVPEMRSIMKDYKDLEFHSALNLFDELWNSGNHEEMCCALYLLEYYVKKYPEYIWKFMLERAEKAKSWDHVDEMSGKILGVILADDMRLMNEIKPLSENRNPWLRRISIVATGNLIRKNRIELTLRLAEKLVYDKDIYVQKGAGWMLREVGKKNRLSLREFLTMHMDMKAAAFSYATEKMPELRKVRKEMIEKQKKEEREKSPSIKKQMKKFLMSSKFIPIEEAIKEVEEKWPK